MLSPMFISKTVVKTEVVDWLECYLIFDSVWSSDSVLMFKTQKYICYAPMLPQYYHLQQHELETIQYDNRQHRDGHMTD